MVEGAVDLDGVSARNTRRLRIARAITVWSVYPLALAQAFWAAIDADYLSDVGLPPWIAAVAAVPAAGSGVLLVLLIRGRVDGPRAADRRLVVWSLVLSCVSFALVQSLFNSALVLATWWGLVANAVPSRTSRNLGLALAALSWLKALTLPLVLGIPPLAFTVTWVFGVGFALLFRFLFASTFWLWDITNDAIRGQAARARLAVTEERLRFARDMHDLLGHSLSALAVKAELAGRLAERSPDRARTEMSEVQDLARAALQQVRGAVSGYREVDLAGEVASVGGVLEANGTRVAVSGLDGPDLPPRTAALAAWVVREGGTNVLRHSDASRCSISFSRLPGPHDRSAALVVEVFNDRAHDGGERGSSSGSGLAGLSERVSLGGGSLSAARTKDGGFLLRAVLPLETGAGTGPAAAEASSEHGEGRR
ncbi:sensor histidine kinase [Nocardiopsis tropica]|uniref:Histidine kinase n=1 Tax=Nocardiopsis tropica TaxID=109330 RepID=A0ABU7KV24_9ACTN|nr:histidine kinase [Nocardiopsis umidischolae]MEE2053119.1 histidine kinase [Nocardiopsis umidischolae]